MAMNKRQKAIAAAVEPGKAYAIDDALKIVQARRDRAIAGRRAARGGGVADRRARVAKSREARNESAETTESTAVESGEATAAPETTNTPDSAEETS